VDGALNGWVGGSFGGPAALPVVVGVGPVALRTALPGGVPFRELRRFSSDGIDPLVGDLEATARHRPVVRGVRTPAFALRSEVVASADAGRTRGAAASEEDVVQGPSSTPSDPDALPDPIDLAARLRRAAADRPDHPALIAGDVTWTYGELDARVDAVTAVLQGLGVIPGERVALVLGTTPAFVVATCAVLRAGVVLVPLLPGLAPDELRYALRDSGAVAAIVGPERGHEVGDLRGDLPDLRHLLVTGVEVDGADDLDALASDAGDPTRVDRSPDELAALVYTSGTTGRPRGAMLTRGNLAANQDQSLAGRFEVGPDDRILLVLPLAHIYSLNVGLGACFTTGATMVLVERFDPAATLDAIETHEVTILLGAPPMYVAWLEGGHLAGRRLRSLRLAASGAAPLPAPVLLRFAEATGLLIHEGYGLTEAAPAVTSAAVAPEVRPGSVGMALPGIELRLVDDEGKDVEPGDPGEVWVRGPNVFRGYWNDDEATAAALTPDGWLRTGDVGTLDDDGFLHLVDRKRDLIIVNGFNVYPREVERVLLEDDNVAEVAVVGAPHPLSGEMVVAHVVERADGSVDVDTLAERCRTKLARYKCPSRIEVVTQLPYTATGKVRRGQLREAS
jgi:long-chain acyl-CoA synthetase